MKKVILFFLIESVMSAAIRERYFSRAVCELQIDIHKLGFHSDINIQFGLVDTVNPGKEFGI